MRHRETTPAPFLLHHRIKKYLDLPVHTSSDSLRTLESGFKNVQIRLTAVEFAGCLWTEAVSGKKKISGYLWTGPKMAYTTTMIPRRSIAQRS